MTFKLINKILGYFWGVTGAAKMFATCDFLSSFYFFPISPCTIVFDLYIFVICNDFGGMQGP